MKYFVQFTSLGVFCAALAVHYRPWGFLLLWPAVALFLNGAAYRGPWPSVFGKGSDGRVSRAAIVVFLPYVVLLHGVWHALRLFSSERPFDDVNDRIYIGRRLLAREPRPEVDVWIDLTAEFSEPREIAKPPGYVALPILDGSVPTAEGLDTLLDAIGDRSVYIHCAQGHGRTAIVAICLLLKQRVVTSVDDGLDLLRAVRPGVRLSGDQRRFVEDFCNRRRNAVAS